ncbi:MAG: tail fiber domain-containing protein [Deltaproteobacteria bacterium]|nr:tail fiber domain-containing protein [Candidatus Tharpella aukensis]
MRNLQQFSFFRLLLVCLIALGCTSATCTPAAALTTAEVPTISAIVNHEAIEWTVEPGNTYERLVLVVIGPEKSAFRLIFEARETPYLGLNSLISSGLPDGLYKYELRLIPTLTPEAREFIDLARKGDNRGLIIEAQEAGLLPTEGSVLAGSFSVDQGLFVLPDTSETFQRGDQVIHDDLIVDGSACIGMDCVNGESFGFDTLRLKENNLRLNFQDTSSTSSFPSNDWRIVINDSSNGGANYFAIEDSNTARHIFKVEAGAPANSIYVDDNGRVGLGTSTPVVELHINDGDTPTVRLEQDGSSGFQPQTWDMAGNEANFFIRDATNGSPLPFRIQPSTPNNTLCLRSSGYVGIGTWDPAYKLDIVGQLRASEGFIAGSSRDLKQNIEELSSEDAFKTLQKLAPVTYQYKTNQNEGRVGFIAEDVPEIVAVNGRKGLSSMDIVAILTKVLQEQQQVINDQKKALQKLDHKLTNLAEDLNCYNY